MIYISSACSKQKFIGPAVKELSDQGVKNIELSGGTRYYDAYEADLIKLQKKYDLTFLVHNYFPPPKNPFVLNLASLDRKIYKTSIEHLKKSLELTRKLGGKQFGFHAGFFVDPRVDEIGRKFGSARLYDKEKALKNFIAGVHILKDEFKEIDLYIENNCYSASNYQVYGRTVPFMLLCFDDYKALQKKMEFILLLDIGHLMVSSKTLGLDFKKELQDMVEVSDYIHISYNDSLHDQNLGLTKENWLVRTLNQCDWKNKTISLEIYDGRDALKETYSIVSSWL